MTPKNAPLETALLVPVLGDWIVTPVKMIEPRITPTVTAVNVLHQLRPKAMPSEPNTMLPKPNCGPNIAHARFRGLEWRSLSGT